MTGRGPGRSQRDVLVTGMGFCLPGEGRPVLDTDDFWQVVSAGRSHLEHDGFHHGTVPLTPGMFTERFPEVPEGHRRHYAPVHLFGMVSMWQACADAGLDWRAGDLSRAAVLTARAGTDSNFDSYLAWYRADPDTIGTAQAKDVIFRVMIAGTANDVGNVLAGLTRATGPVFSVTCGCASSGVLLGIARRMIATGEVDVAVVAGVDAFETGRLRHGKRLVDVASRRGGEATFHSAPPVATRFDVPMRPYDRDGEGMNLGDGAVTLVLESRDHAERRGARVHGRILAQATTRSGLPSAVSIDESGGCLVSAVRSCLEGGHDLGQIPYVNGGAEGDPLFNVIEANAISALYGSAAGDVLVTSQEGCFGHDGAPLGAMGVASTLLMMRHGRVAPTANCRNPAEVCTFDPVPGTVPRDVSFSRALSFNYQLGGVSSVLLLEGPDGA